MAFEKEFPGASWLSAQVLRELEVTGGLGEALVASVARRHGLSHAALNAMAVIEGSGGPVPAGTVGTSMHITSGTNRGSGRAVRAAGRGGIPPAGSRVRRNPGRPSETPAALAAMPWTVSDWPLQLTLAEAQELRLAIAELVVRYRRDPDHPDTPPDAVRAYAFLQLIPEDS